MCSIVVYAEKKEYSVVRSKGLLPLYFMGVKRIRQAIAGYRVAIVKGMADVKSFTPGIVDIIVVKNCVVLGKMTTVRA